MSHSYENDYQDYKAPYRPHGKDITSGFSDYRKLKLTGKDANEKLNQALRKFGYVGGPRERRKLEREFKAKKMLENLIGMDGDGI